LLASSNYTDNQGVMSMGVNAKVAMLPYKGFSMDDAIVVSESFAKKMSSQHNY
jgi:DNA-directed RNA polymerase beta subunit